MIRPDQHNVGYSRMSSTLITHMSQKSGSSSSTHCTLQLSTEKTELCVQQAHQITKTATACACQTLVIVTDVWRYKMMHRWCIMVMGKQTNRTSLVNTAEQEEQKLINTTHTPSLLQAHSIRTDEKQKELVDKPKKYPNKSKTNKTGANG